MNHTMTSQYTGRNRSRSKQPIYTSDKRAKFTQRENKKSTEWIRFLTVVGYVVCVSAPAISLSFYYTHVWDPDYIKKFPPGVNVTDSLTIYKSPIQPQRNIRELPRETPLKAQETQCSCPNKCKEVYFLNIIDRLFDGSFFTSIVFFFRKSSISIRINQ